MSRVILERKLQDKDAKLDWDVNWKAFLKSDTLKTSTFITNLAQHQQSSFQSRTSKVWIDATSGSCGQTYVVTNRIVTVLGRETDRSFEIKIVEK